MVGHSDIKIITLTQHKLMFTVVVGSVMFITSDAVSAEDPSAQQLIALAPVIKSSDDRFSSIEIRGVLGSSRNSSAHIAFRMLKQSPDQFSLSINDGEDATPIMRTVNKQLFYYDVLRGCVFLTKTISTQFCFVPIPSKGSLLSWGIGDPRTESDEIVVDIKSLFETESLKHEVQGLGDNKFRLTQTGPGRIFVASVDLAQVCRFTDVKVFGSDNIDPLLTFNKLCVNHKLDKREFEPPSLPRLAEVIEVRDRPLGGVPQFRKNMHADIITSLVARIGVHKPELREEIAKMPDLAEALNQRSMVLDWQRIEANDRRFSRALRAILNPGG